MRGRPPKPTKLKLLKGNPGRRPLKKEPEPAAGAPPCPAWLSPEAQVEWKRIVPELEALGLLTRVDLAALSAYCQAWAEFQEATKLLDAEGRVIDVDKFGRQGDVCGSVKRKHPAVELQHAAMMRVKQFLTEFGLSPASRSRIHAPGPEGEADPMEAFLRGEAS